MTCTQWCGCSLWNHSARSPAARTAQLRTAPCTPRSPVSDGTSPARTGGAAATPESGGAGPARALQHAAACIVSATQHVDTRLVARASTPLLAPAHHDGGRAAPRAAAARRAALRLLSTGMNVSRIRLSACARNSTPCQSHRTLSSKTSSSSSGNITRTCVTTNGVTKAWSMLTTPSLQPKPGTDHPRRLSSSAFWTRLPKGT